MAIWPAFEEASVSEDFIEGGAGKPDWIKDPETGQLLPIEIGPDYSAAIHKFFEMECKHEQLEPMRITIADGRTQIVKCCTSCGERRGTPLGQKDRAWVHSLPQLPAELHETYKSRRLKERHAILLELARKQFAERGRFTKSYRAYITSPEWKSRRARVMKRCGGICEGCGDSAAVEVHHLTYRHFMEEFLFELVGLCQPCHERYHHEEEAPEEQEAA